jgi:hypothetical protein
MEPLQSASLLKTRSKSKEKNVIGHCKWQQKAMT